VEPLKGFRIYNAALTSATECRQSKANTERENMKECGDCNNLKESTGYVLVGMIERP